MAALEAAIQRTIDAFIVMLDGRVKPAHDSVCDSASSRKAPSRLIRDLAAVWRDPVSAQRHFTPQRARDDGERPGHDP